ncbi:hypothetical protein O5287_13800 [Escherichia coli]|nr:hypothetical protein [Escherichia coli]
MSEKPHRATAFEKVLWSGLNLWINKTKTATCTIYVSGQYRFEVAKMLIFIVDNIYRASFHVAALF